MIPETELLEALFTAHEAVQPLIDMQDELCGSPASRSGRSRRPRATRPRGDRPGARAPEAARGAGEERQARALRGARRDARRDGGRARRRRSGADEARRRAGRQAEEAGRARGDRPRRQAGRRPRPGRHPPDHLRGGGAAAHARLGAVHARRDAGAGGHHARHVVRRAEDRCADRRALQEVHAALQLPAVQHRRGEVPARPGPPRDRPRRARRARAVAGAAGRGRLPVHDPHRVGDARVERLVVHGHGVRRLAVADGGRRADQGRRWPASPWG